MKKLLIGSTALVAAGMLATGANAADKIKLGLTGYMDNFVGTSTNKRSYLNSISGNPNIGGFDVQQDTEVWVSGSTKLDNGLTVGVKWELETNVGTQGNNTDKAYTTISSPTLGTISLGANDMAADALHHRPSVPSRHGLELGDAKQWIQVPSGAVYQHYTSPTGATQAMNVTYETPSFSGFKVGASYTSSANDENPQTSNGATSDAMMWQSIVAYNGKVSNVSIGADVWYSAMGSSDLKGNTQPSGYKQLGGGLQVGMAGFKVSGAYKKVDQKKASTGTSNHNGKVYDIAAEYSTGPMSVGVGWLRSQMEGSVTIAADDKLDIYTLQGTYDLGGGIKLSASIDKLKYNDETTNASKNNEGWAAVGGVEVTF